MPAQTRRSSRKAASSNAAPAKSSAPSRTPKHISSKALRKSTAKATKKSTSANLPSALSLLSNSQQTTDDWYKSPRTKKGYANYVKSGKTWLVDWTAEGRLDDEISSDAFDVITAQTPLALRARTAYKCEHLERGFASAEGLRSAFKDYFGRVCGCQGDFWKFNDHTEKWEGNPVYESNFKVYYELLKNRHNRTGTATQALPMLPADLKIIMEYLDSEDAIKYFTVTQRLYFKAFVTTAFTLWTRNDELISLQVKDIKFDQRSKTGIPYHEFSLVFRKTNKDPTKVQKYKVQADLTHPEIDCYTHTNTWKSHMEGLLGHSLSGSDYLFPAIASTGKLKFGECTSRSAFETLLETVVEKSNVMQGHRKWSLKAVKWWGGWSSNENVGTLMRYLLDELMAYEEGFSDIMMDDRLVDRHETFKGEDQSAPLCKADLLRLEGTLLAKLQGLIANTSSPTNPIISASSSNIATTSARSIAPPAAIPRAQSPPAPVQYTPQPARIPETNTLDDALQYWEHGCPQKGPNVPLKEWAQRFKSSDYAKEAVKLGNIRFVCEEFTTHCGADFIAFEAKYPGLRKKFTMLMSPGRKENQRGYKVSSSTQVGYLQ
ncbi:hypothetical protein B0H16DRAFT_1460271 [Mycena metata]|uniref:Tyr recombinase domain-containing protein n=1 Tax=Mycena metata TaxID=1033252 RepID=A0AAD7IXG6_9AGAR|nr:hypothetical protein B0H16DRAFT_1460271 [Mycena metata]